MVEAARIVEEGIADVEDVDKACKLGFGHAMGPLLTADLSGLDTVERVADNLAAQLRRPLPRAADDQRARQRRSPRAARPAAGCGTTARRGERRRPRRDGGRGRRRHGRQPSGQHARRRGAGGSSATPRRGSPADAGVRAVVLTGAGDKAFMAGADLAEFQRLLDGDGSIEDHVALEPPGARGSWRRSPSPSSPPFRRPRWAAGSRWRSSATSSSPTRRRGSACPRCGSA